jgi:hypothetical protein
LGGNYQPVIELYQTTDHPALSSKSGNLPWRVAVAHLFGGFCSTTWKTRQKNPPIDWEVWEGVRYAVGMAWLIFTTAIVFLMISPNLHDTWPVFFLILSCYETAHFLIVFRPSGDSCSLLGSKK